MKYAILNENNIVENIAESTLPLQYNWYEIDRYMPVSVGDILKKDIFYSPEGEIRLNPIQLLNQQSIDTLDKENLLNQNQIQELNNIIIFFEDCIAEIATKLYS